MKEYLSESQRKKKRNCGTEKKKRKEKKIFGATDPCLAGKKDNIIPIDSTSWQTENKITSKKSMPSHFLINFWKLKTRISKADRVKLCIGCEKWQF